MLRARDLHKSFGRTRAVAGIGFQIPAGRVTGLLGPNGAGKTTTIRMLVGHLRPDRGSVFIGNADIARRPILARRRFGYLPESAPLYPELSAEQHLRFRARLHGVRRRERAAAVAEAIERCSLGPVARTRVEHLSKGYRQRVALACCLLHDPEVLILDEPTNGLDPSQLVAARTLIRDLAERRAVLVSSHILGEIEQTCDTAIVIAGGRLLAEGPISHIGRPPARALLARFVPGEGAGVADLLARLHTIAGVARAETTGRDAEVITARIELRHPPETVAPAVAACLLDRACRLLELREDAASLESRVTALIAEAGRR